MDAGGDRRALPSSKLLPFPPRFRAREYLDLNPMGTIPLMIDGETRMTKSAAICQYLADRYAGPPLSVLPTEPGYGAYLNALHFGEATLTFPQTIALRYGQLEAAERRLPQAVADYERWTLARMRAFETWLGGADFASGGAIHRGRHLDLLCADDDPIHRYLDQGPRRASRLLRATLGSTGLRPRQAGARRRRDLLKFQLAAKWPVLRRRGRREEGEVP